MDKKKARILVRYAVRMGYLKKPSNCEKCNKPTGKEKLGGHHPHGYSDPYDVVFLCFSCHANEHKGIVRKSKIKISYVKKPILRKIKSGTAKINMEIARSIRSEYDGRWGCLRMLSKKYGINVNTIKPILSGDTWREE